MKLTHCIRLTILAALSLSSTTNLVAQQATGDDKANAAELAKKLQNPVADLISVPIQNNWDFGIGPEDAMRYTANIQPVIPFSLERGLESHHAHHRACYLRRVAGGRW